VTVQRRFRAVYQTEPPADRTISEWYKKFQQSGCLCAAKRTGRQGPSAETVESVRQTFGRSPQKSTHGERRELQMPQSSVWRILRKRLRVKGYRLHIYAPSFICTVIRGTPKYMKSISSFLVLRFKICVRFSSLTSMLRSYTVPASLYADHPKMYNEQYEFLGSSSLCIILLPHTTVRSHFRCLGSKCHIFPKYNNITVKFPLVKVLDLILAFSVQSGIIRSS
jgi:hypothetical protein